MNSYIEMGRWNFSHIFTLVVNIFDGCVQNIPFKITASLIFQFPSGRESNNKSHEQSEKTALEKSSPLIHLRMTC